MVIIVVIIISTIVIIAIMLCSDRAEDDLVFPALEDTGLVQVEVRSGKVRLGLNREGTTARDTETHRIKPQ